MYIVFMNVLAFIFFGLDKYFSKAGKWRIPEKVLFLLTIVGGSIGAISGMYCFHHKTLHRRFKYGLPAILLLQIALTMCLYVNGNRSL